MCSASLHHFSDRPARRCVGVLVLMWSFLTLSACDGDDVGVKAQAPVSVKVAIDRTESESGVPMGVGIQIEPEAPDAAEAVKVMEELSKK